MTSKRKLYFVGAALLLVLTLVVVPYLRGVAERQERAEWAESGQLLR